MSRLFKAPVLMRLAGLLALAALTACGGGQDDLDDYTRSVLNRPAEPIDPIPPVRTYDPVPYTSADDRNPFVAITQEQEQSGGQSASSGPRPDPNRAKEYLERFSLDALAMVGTFNDQGTDSALVSDPDGVVHRVQVGNYLGESYGRITSIEDTEITLRELIPDGSGGWLVREASMALEDS